MTTLRQRGFWLGVVLGLMLVAVGVRAASSIFAGGGLPANGVNGNCLQFDNTQPNNAIWSSCGSGNLPNSVQGDTYFASATNTPATLAKSTSADRLLCNTGTNNNPAWCQADLTKAVTAILPSANGGTGMAFFTVAGPATSAKRFTFPNADATVLTDNAAVTVGQGGTGLTSGTNGGIPVFTGTTTIASSGVLTANAPVIGGGAGAVVSVGSRSGNTTVFATTSGALVSGNCLKADASGNVVDQGSACGGSGSPGGSNTQVQYNNSSSFGGSSGITLTATVAALANAHFPAPATKAISYTIACTDGPIYGNVASGGITITLPTTCASGHRFLVKKTSTSDTNAITVNTSSGTIDGAASVTIVSPNATGVYEFDGTNFQDITGGSPCPDPNVASAALIWNNTTKACTWTAGGLAIASGKVLTASNTITLAGTDGKTLTLNANLTLAGTDGTTITFQGTDTYVGRATSDTLTNKTLDCVAGTGNHCTFSFYPLWAAGVCQNVTASIGASMPASNAPTAACKTGTNTNFGVAQYTATTQSLQGFFQLPNDWVAAQTMTYELAYMDETTSAGNNVWTLSTSCVAAGSTLDPSWTDTTITDAAGTANQLNVANGNVTMPTCAARSLMFWKLTFTTQPTTSGTHDLVTLSLGMTRKPQ